MPLTSRAGRLLLEIDKNVQSLQTLKGALFMDTKITLKMKKYNHLPKPRYSANSCLKTIPQYDPCSILDSHTQVLHPGKAEEWQLHAAETRMLRWVRARLDRVRNETVRVVMKTDPAEHEEATPEVIWAGTSA